MEADLVDFRDYAICHSFMSLIKDVLKNNNIKTLHGWIDVSSISFSYGFSTWWNVQLNIAGSTYDLMLNLKQLKQFKVYLNQNILVETLVLKN